MTSGPRSSTGLDTVTAATLAYLLGAISGVVLLVIERRDRVVRFHAMQSTLTFLGVAVATLALGSFPVTGVFLAGVVYAVALAVWVVLIFKALTGEVYAYSYLRVLQDLYLIGGLR